MNLNSDTVGILEKVWGIIQNIGGENDIKRPFLSNSVQIC